MYEAISREPYFKNGPDAGHEDTFDYDRSRADFYERAVENARRILLELPQTFFERRDDHGW